MTVVVVVMRGGDPNKSIIRRPVLAHCAGEVRRQMRQARRRVRHAPRQRSAWRSGNKATASSAPRTRAGWMETRSELGEVNQSDYLNRQFVRQQTPARTGVVSAIELAKAKNEASVARNRGRPR
jgi:predicted N-acyltransferase